MVRYYGYYSNVSRGKRRQEGIDDAIPCILESQGSEKAFRKSWARLIQKIYEVDPLVCPKCQGAMRIISFIEDPSVIRDILNHLGLWLARARPPPKAHTQWGHDAASCPHECAAGDLQLQTHADNYLRRPRILLGCLYSCITPHKKGVPERSVWITPEKAFLIGEMAEKRFALQIVRAPGYIPSTIIGATPHILWLIFP